MAPPSPPRSGGKLPSGEAVMLNAALESMPYGFSIWDDRERLILFNQRFADLYSLPAEVLRQGISLPEICELTLAAGNYGSDTAAELLATRRRLLAEAAKAAEGYVIEKTVRGRVIKSSYLRRPPIGTIITHEDITETRERENELPGKLLSEILEGIGAGVCLWDADLKLTRWNRAYRDLQVLPGYELKSGASLGEVFDHCVPTRDDARTGAELERLARELLAKDGQIEIDRPLVDGRILSVTYHPFSSGGWIAIYQDVTERRADVQRIRDSERDLKQQNLRFEAAVDNMPHGLCMFDKDQRLVIANSRYAEMYELPPELVAPGTSHWDILHYRLAHGMQPTSGIDVSAFLEKHAAAIAGGQGKTETFTLGNGRTITITHQAMEDGGWVATHQDITEERERIRLIEEREAELRIQNMRFTAAVNNMSQGLCMFDAEERLVICNKPYADMYNMPEELVKPGALLTEILAHRIAHGTSPTGGADAYFRRRRELVENRVEDTDIVELQDGRTISIMHHPMADGGWVATHHDITEERRNEARIRHLARHDGLTDLPNRVHFRERMEAAQARIGRGDTMAALFIDLDHFKSVNDLLGHATGDAVLRAVASRMRQCVRGDDVVARLGGDEFAILHGPLAEARDAAVLADRIVKAMAEPFDIERHHVLIGASVGIAVAPSDGTDAETLMKNADLALYRAKAEGRGAYHFFEKGMDALIQERLAIEIGLRSAVANGELELVFQPLFNLVENRICAVEALLRWNHPERGLIMPQVLIPIAEESGLIVPIGEWVLRHACLAAAQWPTDIHVAVNLSPVQFKHRSLLNHVVAALAVSGIAPQRLELEVTESALLADNEMTLRTLHQLRALGVRISMDDFGTGYSSLSYLRSFPFDKIKIDQSFVRDISARHDSLAIIKAVIGLGHSLGMATTAEGIETEAQLDMVRKQGCTEVQGYLFSRPLSEKGIADLFGPRREPASRIAS